MIIGLSGPVSSGKSTVAKMIRDYGGEEVQIINADDVVRALMSDPEVSEKIVEIFGNDIEVDIRKEIMKDPLKLDKMEAITLPKLEEREKEIINNSKARFIILDYPNLYETATDERCDYVIALQCPSNIRHARYMDREKPDFRFMQLLESRMQPNEEKVEKADFVIDTSKDMRETDRQVIQTLKSLRVISHNVELEDASIKFERYRFVETA